MKCRAAFLPTMMIIVCLATALLLMILLIQNEPPASVTTGQVEVDDATTSTTQLYRTFQTTDELIDAVDLFLRSRTNDSNSSSSSSSSSNAGGDNASSHPDIGRYGPIETWDVSQITNFGNLFNARRNPLAAAVRVDLSRWDVSNAEYMHDMFLGAAMIDFDVSTWNVANVRHFNGMFEMADSFRGVGLDWWNVEKGQLFMSMFSGARSLSPALDLSGWNVLNAQRLGTMFRDSNFGSGLTSRQRTEGLCAWMHRLNIGVDTEGMFAGTKCPDTRDPDLVSRLSISLCVPCEQPSRPNILMIIVDQMRFDMIQSVQTELEWYQNSLKIRTPNLDRLKASGAYFKNAYCQAAVCAPARTSLRTGCTIERTGIQANALIDEEYRKGDTIFQHRVQDLVSIDHVLVEKLGYVTEYYGKWHLPDELTQPRSPSWNLSSHLFQNNDYDYESEEFFYLNDVEAFKQRRYLQHFDDLGFIDKSMPEEGMQIDSFTRYPYTPIQLDSRWQMPTDTDLNNGSFERYEKSEPNIMGRFKLSEQYTPSFFTGDLATKAMKRLQDQQGRDNKPWFLTASFHHPHPPMVAAWKYLQYYWNNRSELLTPPSIADTLDNSPYRSETISRLPGYRDADKVKEWTALYYALIEEIDVHVGNMMDALGNDANNTLVVFTSDHGEMLGAHGEREKNVFYEESSRVPLFLSFPGVIEPNTVVNEMVSHLDVVATILDYVGASDLDRSDGRSLRPFVESRGERVNSDFDEDVVFAEWDFRMPVDDATLDRSIDERPSFMVRKGQWKLMMQKLAASSEWDLLVDLEKDPFEMENLLGRHAMSPTDVSDLAIAKAEHLRCLLLDWMIRLDGPQGYFSDPAANYGEGRGDIAEIRDRQQWRKIGLWVSDESTGLAFRKLAWTGSRLVRHEWLYIGTRAEGDLHTITSASITGADAAYFSVDGSVAGRTVAVNECLAIRVTFEAEDGHIRDETRPVDAILQLDISSSGTASSSSRRISVPLVSAAA